MKNSELLKKLGKVGLIAILAFSLNSCSVFNAIKDLINLPDAFTNLGNDTNQILDQATRDINANASNFNEILNDAIDNINNNTVKNALQELLENAIVTDSTEIRCDIQFVGDYIVKEIYRIKAEYNNEDAPIFDPKICSTIPEVIDMNLPPNQRNSVNITGYFLTDDFSKYRLYLYDVNGARYNKTSALSQSSSFKLIVNLGNNGILLNNNSDRLILYWDDAIVTEIPVLQHIPEICDTREWTFENLPKLIIYPEHKRNPWNHKKGDKEFKGNGPCTKGYVILFTKNNGKELWAKSFVRMWECPDDFSKMKSDFTYGDRYKELKIADAPNGWRILKIKESTSDSFQNIDKNTGASQNVSGGGPIAMYQYHGDFDGNDLGILAGRAVLRLRSAACGYIYGHFFRKVQHCADVEIYAMEPGTRSEVGLK